MPSPPSPLCRLLLALLAIPASGCVDYSISHSDASLGADDAVPKLTEQHLPGAPDEEICARLWDPPTTEIPINDSCAVEIRTGPLDAAVEWRIDEYNNYREYGQAVMTPLVGQLSDDNGDGRLGPEDAPDIVIITDDDGYTASEHGVLRIISGDGSGQQRAVQRIDLEDAQIYPYRYSNAALGDIDGDGLPEIVIVARIVGGEIQPKDTGAAQQETGTPGGDKEPMDSGEPEDDKIRPPPPAKLQGEGCVLAAYTHELELEWYATGLDLPCGGHAPALADLEGDSDVEVVIGPYIFEGRDGSVVAQGQADVGRFLAYNEMGLHSIVTDLDGDGTMEIIAGRTVYAPDGRAVCEGGAGSDGFTAAADLDLDGQGEFLVVGNGQATVFEADCAVAQSWALPGGGSGGPPTIADYDGDGAPEIGMADATTYSVYEADGTVLWSTPVTDASSHATGSVVFDFEGDGFPEVVYGDEVSLWIYDGRDGTVRYESNLHESRTLHEYPTVADVDGDGSAEIITVRGGSHYGPAVGGLYVYGSVTDGWEGGRTVWHQHAYSITNVADDLTIPESPTPNWPLYNNFRSGDVNPLSGANAPDAVPVFSVCEEECSYGRIVLAARIGNQGPVALRAGLELIAYAEQEDGSLVEVARARTSAVALEGEASDMVELDLPADQLPTGVVWLTADGTDAVSECEEDNNSVRIAGLSCPP